MDYVDESVLDDIAQQLLDEISQENRVVDKELLELAENLIQSHQFYVQLMFVGLIIKRIRRVSEYYDVLDSMVESISSEDFGELSSTEQIRSVSVISNAIKAQLETVQAMHTSKDSSNTMLSYLQEYFTSGRALTEEEKSEGRRMLDTVTEMKPDQRERVLKGVIQALRFAAEEEKSNG